MGLSEDERRRVHSPAGLGIGARTAPEIALSILAEIVTAIRTGDLARAEGGKDVASQPSASVASSGPAAFAGADDIRRRLDELDYLVDDGMATALFLALTLGQPLLLEGEPGRRQDRRREGAGPRAGHPADPAAVLRGPDRRRGALRVELPAPAARDPAGRVARREADRRRPVHRGVPAGAADPAASGTTGRSRPCC